MPIDQPTAVSQASGPRIVALRPPFRHGGGHCWQAVLPPELLAECDAPGAHNRSCWQLLEDGVAIGAGHALHDDIRNTGAGAHSHWNELLYFATSDGTDPNGNGRAYALRWQEPAAAAARPAAAPVASPVVAESAGGPIVARLADILRRRQVREIVYFHADHFEPWSNRSDEQRWRGLEHFAAATRQSWFGRKLSLFYTPWLVHALDGAAGGAVGGEVYRDGDDGVVFKRRPATFVAGCQNLVRPLETEIGHEFHIHVHHEGWSRTTSDFGEVSAWVNANSTAKADSRRLEFYLQLSREVMQEEIGRPFDHWGFVHGNWSLNAADPRSCQIEDEIIVLMQQGCYGDFTFPAGEAKCNPVGLEFPYTCRPVVGAKSYEWREADPQPLAPGAGVIADDRFLIWNSPIKATHSSLDFFNEANCQLYREPEALVTVWLEQSVVIGHRLYVKTHAHSLHKSYRPWETGALFPHSHPDIVGVFELLRKAADAAAVPLACATVGEVMQQLRASDRGEEREEPALPSQAAAPPPVAIGDPGGLDAFKAALFEAMQAVPRNQVDSYYADRIARQSVLEPYEGAILDYVRANLPPGESRLFEVGIGWGMLSLSLAALGYEVVGFVAQHDHADIAGHLLERATAVVPGIADRLRIVRGLFPAALTPDMLAGGRRNVLLIGNLVHSFSAENQQAILDAGLRFDRFLLETGAFGTSRPEPQREQLKERLGQQFDIDDTIWRNRLVVLTPRIGAPVMAAAVPAPASAPAPAAALAAAETPQTASRLALMPPFRAQGGYCWVAALPPAFAADADGREAPRRSTWLLTEDGAPLARPHSIHADIAELGEGRFSHWREHVFFATSDNSDPNTNGRSYALQRPGAELEPEAPPAVAIAAAPAAPAAAASPAPAPAQVAARHAGACRGLIAIFGASFSGSTLLNTVLGAHPQIFGGGELHWLLKNPENTRCAICRGECQFWTPEARTGITEDGLYDQVSALFGRPFVVDISKMREWYAEILPHFPDLPVVRVLLVKHPVRHVSSFIEKKETAGSLPDGTPAYSTWDRTVQRLRAFYEGFVLPGETEPEIKYNPVAHPTPVDVVIRYEDFVASPSLALRPVLSRLGLEYDPSMDQWPKAEHHHIGGNIGPRVQINNDTPDLESAARKYQRQGIFLDNSFGEILDLETIELVLRDPDANWIRQRFGYKVPAIAAGALSPGVAADPETRPKEVRRVDLAPPFFRDDGHCWYTALPAELLADSDDSANKYRSPWRLTENGKPIGVAHALHDEIRAAGRGWHSHWKDRLYFATSDNSDPNTNGRPYGVMCEVAAVPEAPQPRPAAIATPSGEAAAAPPRPRPQPDGKLDELADILKRREVREVVYFHTDHFEPWGESFEEGIRRLEGFAALSRGSRYGRRLSLFYTPPVSYDLGEPRGPSACRVDGDGIYFTTLDEPESGVHREAIGSLVEAGHEFHLHIHHTRWTRNSGNVSAVLKEWLDAHSSPEADSRRLDLFTRLSCESIAMSTGRPFDRWAFIHGLWALNASDPTACLVEDEIAILMRHGCFGDFTFPAGRAHCDPTIIEAPYTCLPAVAPKSYDLPEADPRPLLRGAGALRDDRFFIWNSPIKANQSSIDYYHAPNRELFADPTHLVGAWLDRCVTLDDTLYIKTHSHSLEPTYRIGFTDGVNPHLHQPIVAMFELLERVCEQAAVPLNFLTVNEVMTRLRRFDRLGAAAAGGRAPVAGALAMSEP